MAENESHITIETTGDISRVSFLDRNILEETVIQSIGDQIADLIDRVPNPRLLIDFSEVDHLSSAALGMLITVNNQIKQKSGQLRLANIDPQIYEVFAITKLNKLFHILNDAQEAIKSFK